MAVVLLLKRYLKVGEKKSDVTRGMRTRGLDTGRTTLRQCYKKKTRDDSNGRGTCSDGKNG